MGSERCIGDSHRIHSRGAGGAMLRDIRPGALLVSGGGNHMLGRVDGKARPSDFLRPHVDQTKPAEYIGAPAWTRFVDKITRRYRGLIQSAHAIDPQLHGVLHGHAY